uniref:Putative secreted peptide n=1 Tax=Anopheles braziliensis TaxID=58242 RepID=A0A2M3ZTM6_9DIPT
MLEIARTRDLWLFLLLRKHADPRPVGVCFSSSGRSTSLRWPLRGGQGHAEYFLRGFLSTNFTSHWQQQHKQ